MKLINNLDSIVYNIDNFRIEIDHSNELQNRLGLVRSWYACNDRDLGWSFAPSKFCGYEDMDAECYLKNYNQMDGRKTEEKLSEWFSPLDYETKLYKELYNQLSTFLAQYGKIPNSKTRINVIHELNKDYTYSNAKSFQYKKISDLIIEVTNFLPKEYKTEIKRRI